MKTKEYNRTCYSCADYYKCEKTEKSSWFPACVELSCYKTLVIDERI